MCQQHVLFDCHYLRVLFFQNHQYFTPISQSAIHVSIREVYIELLKMLNRFFFLKVFSLILSLITCSTAQAPATPGPIAFTRDCPDNLSCPRDDGTLQCYSRSQLCNGNQDCVGGSDEGLNLNALDCE